MHLRMHLSNCSQIRAKFGVMTTLELKLLNYLIFRYLHDSGFIHSAFILGYEAGLNTMTAGAPSGDALVSFIQKGLQYLELEANLNEDGTDPGGDFILLEPLELIIKNVDELRQLVKERREKEMERTKADKEMRDKENTKADKEMHGKEKTKADKSGAKPRKG